MAKLQPTTKPLTRIERIASFHPKYAALISRQAELTARYDEILSEIHGPKDRVDATVDGKTGAVTYHDVPLAERQRRTQVSWVSQAPKPVAKPVVRNEAAVALIGEGLLSPLPEEKINPPPPPPSWNGAQRLAELSEELDTISEALQLVAPELAKARLEYSRLVVAQRASEHRELSSAIVDAARALGDAILAQREYLNQARLDGVAYSLFRPVPTDQFGNLDLEHTPLMKVVRDAIELGYAGADKIPAWKSIDIAYLQNGN